MMILECNVTGDLTAHYCPPGINIATPSRTSIIIHAKYRRDEAPVGRTLLIETKSVNCFQRVPERRFNLNDNLITCPPDYVVINYYRMLRRLQRNIVIILYYYYYHYYYVTPSPHGVITGDSYRALRCSCIVFCHIFYTFYFISYYTHTYSWARKTWQVFMISE